MIYIVRHGESDWNVIGRVQGQTAHPRLTERGRAQAARSAALIDIAAGPNPISAIVSSDLIRAVETAEVIGERFGLSPAIDVRLREQQLGALEGLPSSDAADALGAVDWTDSTVRIGGGESIAQVYDRMAATIEPMLGRVTDSTIVVSHGDAIRMALGWLGGFGPVDAPWPEIGNGTVFAVSSDRQFAAL